MPTVTGNIRQIAGTAVTSGLVRFTATTPVIQDRTAKTTRLGHAELVVPISATGTITTSLPATDNTWVYEVHIQAYVGGQEVPALPRLLLPVPAGGADLADAGVKGGSSGQVIINRMVSAGELDAALETALAPVQASVAAAEQAAQDARNYTYRAEQNMLDWEPRIKGIEAMAGISPEGVTDGQTSALVTSPDSLTGKAVRTLTVDLVESSPAMAGVRRDVVGLEAARKDLTARLTVFEERTPESYGAVGNGQADDTQALRAWVQAGWSELPPHAYRINGGLTHTGDRFRLNGNGAVLLVDGADASETRVLSITGDHAEVSGLSIQAVAGAKIRGGIYVYGSHAKVQGNRIEGLVSDLESRGIHVEGPGGGLVSGNRIHNISATGNTTEGDGTGMARGIVIYHRADALLPTLVQGNHLTDILGEEGDGIAVLASAGTGTGYLSSKTSIVGNVVDNCSRRNVKIQGWDVDVHDNTLRDSQRQMYGKEASIINAYASGRLSIKGNTLWYSDLGSSINIQGGATGGTTQDLTISGNSIFGDTGGTSTGIYVDYVNRTVVSGNDIRGGYRGISLGNVSSGAITGNTTERLTSTSGAHAASATSSCSRIAMTNNTDLSVNIPGAYKNDSAKGVTANNHQITA